MKKIRNEEVKMVLPSFAHNFYCRGSARISRKIRFLCLLENLNYQPLPTPTAYHLGSLGLMGLKENLVGVGSLRPVGGSGMLL